MRALVIAHDYTTGSILTSINKTLTEHYLLAIRSSLLAEAATGHACCVTVYTQGACKGKVARGGSEVARNIPVAMPMISTWVLNYGVWGHAFCSERILVNSYFMVYKTLYPTLDILRYR